MYWEIFRNDVFKPFLNIINMFCIKCGKRAVIGNFCRNCFLAKEELFKIKDFSLPICDCGSYYDKIWQKPKDIDDIIRDQIKQRIRTKNKITKDEIKIKKFGNKISATVICSGIIHSHKKNEEKRIIIILKRRKCDLCVKLLGGYYEAVLQIRGDYNKIFDKAKKYLPETARIEKTKHGYDIRFLKKSDAAKIAKLLKNYKIKKSFKFVATKKGKKLYRNYYSVR